jgi:hypothetical protein
LNVALNDVNLRVARQKVIYRLPGKIPPLGCEILNRHGAEAGANCLSVQDLGLSYLTRSATGSPVATTCHTIPLEQKLREFETGDGVFLDQNIGTVWPFVLDVRRHDREAAQKCGQLNYLGDFNAIYCGSHGS